MPGQQFDNTNRGALFRNKKKMPGDNRPDYTGKINITGEEYFLSGWVKKSHAGDSYLSLALQTENRPGGAGRTNAAGNPRAASRNEGATDPAEPPIPDDDIPF